MTLRTSLLKVADVVREIKRTLDQCPNQLSIVQKTWAGGRRGRGASTETILITFPAKFSMREITAADEASSTGLFKQGDVMVTHITPSDGASVGYTPAQLRPTFDQDGIDVIYRITGPLAGDYSLVNGLFGGRVSNHGIWSGRSGIYSYALHLRKRPVDGA